MKRGRELRNTLKSRFSLNKKTANDFVKWAAEKGISFYPNEVSDHIHKKRALTKGTYLAYEYFFSEIETPRVPKEIREWINNRPESLK